MSGKKLVSCAVFLGVFVFGLSAFAGNDPWPQLKKKLVDTNEASFVEAINSFKARKPWLITDSTSAVKAVFADIDSNSDGTITDTELVNVDLKSKFTQGEITDQTCKKDTDSPANHKCLAPGPNKVCVSIQ